MDTQKLKEQVETIRQAFGYINRFKDRTFVIKIESSLLTNPFFPVLIKDISLLHHMGIRIVLVPGAKTRIDEVLATYGMQCATIDSIRVSPPEAIPFIKMAAFDVSNTIMTKLAENDTNAVIGNWVRARGIGVRKGIDFQSSGLVEKLKTEIIQNVLQDGLVPIFPNIGWNSQGKPYNLSSNELAFTVARELHAAKLFFITDFGGISAQGLSIPKGVDVSSEGFVSQLTVDETKKLIEGNDDQAQGAMELASFAYRACKSGVERVHIIDGRIEGMILKEIFSNRGFGTMIYANQFENIRPMAHADIPEVLSLMRPAIDDGILVPRTEDQLEQKLADYVVHEVDGTLHGCGAMHVFSGGKAEIAGIAVDETYGNQGVGRKIVSFLLEKASSLKLKKVFILTTQTADWFSKLGFVKADVADLPKERQQTYNKNRKSLVLAYTVGSVKLKKPLSVD